MARNELRRRVEALEGLGELLWGVAPAIWLVLEPGETSEQGIARYEAKHGPRLPGRPAVIWRPVGTGVPRGEDSICV